MKRVTSVIAGGSLLAGSIAGCTTENAFISRGTEDAQAAFTAVQQYWIGTGLLDASGVRLVTVAAGDTAQCSAVLGASLTVRASDPEVAHYCPDDDTIVIATRSYRDFLAKVSTGGSPKEDIELILMAHEFGHAVEKRRGQLKATELPRLELLADCLGGQAIRDIAPDAATTAGAFYGSLAVDNEHGTPAQRKEQFMQGFNGAAC